MGHDHGNIDFPQNANGIDHPFQELFQNLFVEENQRIHGLILGRGSDVTLHDKMREKFGDFFPRP